MDCADAGIAAMQTFILTRQRLWMWEYATGQSNLLEGEGNKTRYGILLGNE